MCIMPLRILDMKLIERDEYLKEMREVEGTPDIKVLTGVRRSGKSRLMDRFAEDLKNRYENANVIHINFNLTDFEDLQEYHRLEAYVEDHYQESCDNFVLIDEIQMCKGFEKAINSLHAREKYDIYVTGSNAFLQSSDLATLFVGRTYRIDVFPFSFREYSTYYAIDNPYKGLTQYLTEGGMAGSYLYRAPEQKYKYINDEVLKALIVRDIVRKQKIRNVQLLDKLIDYLMDNVGNITSVRSITDTLESNRTKADHKTIGKYIDYLCNSFAFYKIRRYDIRGKKYLRSDDKYYLSDQSFRYARLGIKNMDYGHILENIVAIELLRRGFETYVGVLYKKEVDFVTIRNGKTNYIQVAYDISEPSTLERELSPLRQIRDNYPKILLARTYQPEYEIDGVRVIDVADWLLGK